MKKLIIIILALIMTLYSEISQGADELHMTAEKTPHTAITTTVEQVSEENEKTAEKLTSAVFIKKSINLR